MLWSSRMKRGSSGADGWRKREYTSYDRLVNNTKRSLVNALACIPSRSTSWSVEGIPLILDAPRDGADSGIPWEVVFTSQASP